MNRELFRKNKIKNDAEYQKDSAWAEDVSFEKIETQIERDKKESKELLRPLSADDKGFFDYFSVFKSKDKKENTQKREDSIEIVTEKKRIFSKGYIKFLAIWSGVLAVLIIAFLVRFNFYLKDYEKVYEESLPYHKADEFISYLSENDASRIYDVLTKKPETGEYEDKDSVVTYIDELVKEKKLTYAETRESTDKIPIYHIMADDYIVGELTLAQSDQKRAHKLPIYKVDSFALSEEPQFSANIKTYDNCKVFINDVEVNKSDLFERKSADETHFEDYVKIPEVMYYKTEGLYRRPEIRIVNEFGLEQNAHMNEKTGFYEAPLCVPKETEEEMINFAKKAVYVYAQVVCREANDSALDTIFTRGNKIAHDIKTNGGSLMYFPNHITKDTEDKVVEFIPYSKDAFYCEIEHTQHMLVYGVRPRDVVTDAKFYYVKENGEWRICAVTY